jgi:hypothetical protein
MGLSKPKSSKSSGADDSLRCSFCSKSQGVVGKLISSPSDYPRAYICDECIAVCNSVIADDKQATAAVDGMQPVAQPFELKDFLDQFVVDLVHESLQVFHRHEHSLSSEPGVVVLAIRKPDGRTIFNPPPEQEIAEDDYAIVMGRAANFRSKIA